MCVYRCASVANWFSLARGAGSETREQEVEIDGSFQQRYGYDGGSAVEVNAGGLAINGNAGGTGIHDPELDDAFAGEGGHGPVVQLVLGVGRGFDFDGQLGRAYEPFFDAVLPRLRKTDNVGTPDFAFRQGAIRVLGIDRKPSRFRSGLQNLSQAPLEKLMLQHRVCHKGQFPVTQFVMSARRVRDSFVLLDGKQFRNALSTHNTPFYRNASRRGSIRVRDWTGLMPSTGLCRVKRGCVCKLRARPRAARHNQSAERKASKSSDGAKCRKVWPAGSTFSRAFCFI